MCIVAQKKMTDERVGRGIQVPSFDPLFGGTLAGRALAWTLLRPLIRDADGVVAILIAEGLEQCLDF